MEKYKGNGKREGFPVYISGKQAGYVKNLSERTGLPASTFVRLAIEQYMQKQRNRPAD